MANDMVKISLKKSARCDCRRRGARAARHAGSSDTGRAARIGLWALAIGFGGFLLWAGLAPLDEGVPSQGMVAIDTKRKAVQHLSGGIVKEVLVREGELVKEGQVLIKLDEAVARANYEAVRQRYLGLRAMQGRLLAEQAGQAGYVMHPDLKAAASDPLIRQQMQTQEQLFQSRRSRLARRPAGDRGKHPGPAGACCSPTKACWPTGATSWRC